MSSVVIRYLLMGNCELQEYSIEFNMERCKTDIDISIVDRIRHLLVTRPCFLPDAYHSPVGEESSTGPFAGLKDNFLSNVVHAEPPSSFSLKFYVSEWTVDFRFVLYFRHHIYGNAVDFRIPIADFSTVGLQEYARKSVQNEFLHGVINGAMLRIPKFTPSNLSQCGELIVEGATITCSFIGDPHLMSCSAEEMRFLHASSDEGEGDKRVRLRLSYGMVIM